MNTAVISGGMGGTGKALARTLAGLGYRVVLLYKTTPQKEAAAFVAALPGDGHAALRCDIADAPALAGALKDVHEVAVLVHAAVDPIVRKTLPAMSAREFRAQFEAGVFGGFNLLSLVAPRMQKDGLMVGITSDALEEKSDGGTMPGYLAAKFALRGLLREAAKEFKSVRVVALAPGLMQTKLTADVPQRLFEWMKETMNTPEDVAAKIAFLLSPGGRALRGVSLRLRDGSTSAL